MGLDYTTHIGPFIKVFNPEFDGKTERKCCNRLACNNYLKENTYAGFCPNCGSEIEKVEVPCKKRKEIDISEECDERLYEVFTENKLDEFKDYLFFVSNIRGFGSNFDSKYEIFLKDIDSPKEIEEDLQKFKDAFSNEIRQLKEVFGEQNVEVKWGILGDIS